jgi:hypothetical protein
MISISILRSIRSRIRILSNDQKISNPEHWSPRFSADNFTASSSNSPAANDRTTIQNCPPLSVTISSPKRSTSPATSRSSLTAWRAESTPPARSPRTPTIPSPHTPSHRAVIPLRGRTPDGTGMRRRPAAATRPAASVTTG